MDKCLTRNVTRSSSWCSSRLPLLLRRVAPGLPAALSDPCPHATAPIPFCVGAGGWTWCHPAAHGPVPGAQCPAGPNSPWGPGVRPLRVSCHGLIPLIEETRGRALALRAWRTGTVTSHTLESLRATWQHRCPDRCGDMTRRADTAFFLGAYSAPSVVRISAVLCRALNWKLLSK